MIEKHATSPIAAVFDLDGTLYAGHITRGISLHHRTKEVLRLPLYAFLSLHFPVWWLTRAGLISEERMREVWAKHIPWMFRGWTREQGEEAFRWIAEEYVLPRCIPETLERLRAHQSRGERVIFLSGTPTPLLQAIGAMLDVGEVIGTDITMRNGKFNGRSVLPVCQGEHKGARLLEYLSHSRGVDLRRSYAYADSWTDLSVLRLVGHPVAVRPDERLRSHAAKSTWEIID
jgi:HAD superfamily hydrolase (TIGR01490 family)